MSSIVSTRQQKCLQQVQEILELFRETPQASNKKGISVSCVSLCVEYDNLIEVLGLEDDTTKSVDADVLKLRYMDRRELNLHAIQERITLQSDLLRSLLFVAREILVRTGTIPREQRIGLQEDKSFKNILEETISRTRILLRRLAFIHSEYLQPENKDHPILPSNFPLLDELITQQDDMDIDVIVGESITIDKEQLEKEEEELILMAETPIPNNHRQHKAEMTNEGVMNGILHGHIPASRYSESPAVAITMDDHGVLRSEKPENSSQRDKSMWFLSSDTQISFNAPFLELTHIVLGPPHFEVDSLRLNVGNKGSAWWENVSRMVQHLRPASKMQVEIFDAWPEEECQRGISRAELMMADSQPGLN